MTDFGAELRRRRLAAQLSLDSFRVRVNYSKGYLSKIENGKVVPPREMAQLCDDALAAGGELVALVDDQPSAGPHGLPAPPRHFVGRDRELGTLSSLLLSTGDLRVGVVHGLAGAGKTALVLTAAALAEYDFPDGALFFDLRGHTPGATPLTPGAVAHSALTLLGVPAERIPPTEDGRTNLLRARTRGHRVLLVFDNVADAAQVRPLVPAEDTCRVLITSRARLSGLDDAWQLSTGMLEPDDAVALFRAVAGDRGPDQDSAGEIVRLCGLLPLAVRIAAARFADGGWSAARFRDRLVDERTRLAALDDGERAVAAAFAVSYAGLPADQRRLFGLLARHPGPVLTAESVEAMAAQPPGESDRLLARLHEANLLTLGEHGHGMHDLVRLFAVRHALPEVPAAVRDAAVERLVEHAVAQVAAADRLVEPGRFRPVEGTDEHAPPTKAAAVAWLRALWPTLVRVVDLAGDHGVHRGCWQLAYLLRGFFFRDKLYDPWVATHERGLAAARALGDHSATGMLLNNLGMAHVNAGAVNAALHCHDAAHAAFTAAGDQRGATDALSSLAWARLYGGEPAAALRDLTTVLAEYEHTGRERNAVITHRGIALALTALGRFEEAAKSAQHAFELAERALDDALADDVIMAVTCLAWVHYNAGEIELAAGRYAESANLADLASNTGEWARALTGQGNCAARSGNLAAARAYWGAAAGLGVVLHPAIWGESRARAALG
ncbi:XRE family transcriptional regulator [Actinokineospora sp. NBRC 105648]|uniref:XRE family transcriptional regulator n=1 Tax=Actinokineospora sp. NBRC 105648 TaxID=3032206 RepID=UPI0024A09C46|nr:XRE family transcriptional regulator [Actinokineospora sp. NBRC 105648]GLZ39094.1 hypothetical protein Acsp05_27180 [Actinokineospora sp. NBRC 105648]